MEKTYTMSCDFELTIHGKYSVGEMWEEDIESPLSRDDIWNYIASNITDFYESAELKISNRKTEEET